MRRVNRSGRPNLLLIMVDQLAAQWLPAYGASVVRAPSLSGLAADSVVFDAAYCASPLCAPSRASMLCGRFVSAISVWDNAAELAASVPTLVHVLRAAGYRTCLAGKMHFVGPDQLHGFERRLTTDVYPSGFDWTPDWTRPVADRLPWYHTVASVLEPARTTASLQTDYDDEVAFHAVRAVHDMARSGDDRPFLLVVSFANPHDPWEVPGRYWDLYDVAAIDLPAVPMLSWDEADPHSRRLRQMSAIDEVPLGDADVRRARHGYYAAISYVDERIGSVLSALQECGFDEDTVIVFTADHGEFLGERGLWYKMSFLEPAARVPLFVRLPGSASGRRVSSPVSLVDLAPTLVELAGGSAGSGSPAWESGPAAWESGSAAWESGSAAWESGSPAWGSGSPAWDGASLLGAQRGPVICEYHAEGVNAPAAMIRDERYKLIVCRGDPDQLFDLSRDPLELVNLAESAESASVVRRLRGELERRLDLTDIERRVLESQRERRLVAAALSAGEVHAWDHQPYVDASMQYVRTREDLYELQRRGRLEAR